MSNFCNQISKPLNTAEIAKNIGRGKNTPLLWSSFVCRINPQDMKAFLYKFSIFTIFIALVHFTLETLFTIKFGQTIAGYLPDLIAVALLIIAGYLTIKDSNAIGILCGAWGFAFCLHYRSWAWRFDDVIDGTATELVETTMYVLAFTMPISIISFIITLILCLPKNRNKLNG